MAEFINGEVYTNVIFKVYDDALERFNRDFERQISKVRHTRHVYLSNKDLVKFLEEAIDFTNIRGKVYIDVDYTFMNRYFKKIRVGYESIDIRKENGNWEMNVLVMFLSHSGTRDLNDLKDRFRLDRLY